MQAQQKIRDLAINIRMKEELITELIKTGAELLVGRVCSGQLGSFYVGYSVPASILTSWCAPLLHFL